MFIFYERCIILYNMLYYFLTTLVFVVLPVLTVRPDVLPVFERVPVRVRVRTLGGVGRVLCVTLPELPLLLSPCLSEPFVITVLGVDVGLALPAEPI